MLTGTHSLSCSALGGPAPGLQIRIPELTPPWGSMLLYASGHLPVGTLQLVNSIPVFSHQAPVVGPTIPPPTSTFSASSCCRVPASSEEAHTGQGIGLSH